MAHSAARHGTLKRVGRTLVIGGAVAVIGAWTVFAADGLIAAVSLLVALLAVAITLGMIAATLDEHLSRPRERPTPPTTARPHRRWRAQRCRDCRSPVRHRGTIQFCPGCDHIPAV